MRVITLVSAHMLVNILFLLGPFLNTRITLSANCPIAQNYQNCLIVMTTKELVVNIGTANSIFDNSTT